MSKDHREFVGFVNGVLARLERERELDRIRRRWLQGLEQPTTRADRRMRGPMTCERDDCAGTIVDGYCDVCGLAPARSGSAGRAQAQAHARTRVRSARPSRASRRPGRDRADDAALGRVGAHAHDVAPAAGRRARGGRARAPARPGRGRHGRPRGRRVAALLRALRQLRRARARRPAGTQRGLLPALRRRVLVHAEAATPATSSPSSTRSSAAWPTAGWAGSTSRRIATWPTAGSCSRAC